MSVVTLRSTLTDADVRTLIRGASEDDRAFAAQKICSVIDFADLSEEERSSAGEILRLIAKDAAVMVRQALTATLHNSPKLPADVAMRLAQDIEEIALPILANSPSLSDGDLVQLLRAAGPGRQMAIASRPQLSETVTDVLVETGEPQAVRRALSNDNAVFSAKGLDRTLTRFGGFSEITETMAKRRVLPVGVVEKLVSLVTGEVFDHLVNHHQLPPQIAIELAGNARERAGIDLVEQAGLQGDLARFTQQLNLAGRLTPSFMMRALCLGHMRFIEHAMAELAGLSLHRAWLLLHDAGPLGLKALFDRAGLPPKLYTGFKAGVDVYHQLEREGVAADPARLRQRMIERVLTLFQNVPREDLMYLLEKLDAVREAPAAAAAV